MEYAVHVARESGHVPQENNFQYDIFNIVQLEVIISSNICVRSASTIAIAL